MVWDIDWLDVVSFIATLATWRGNESSPDAPVIQESMRNASRSSLVEFSWETNLTVPGVIRPRLWNFNMEPYSMSPHGLQQYEISLNSDRKQKC